MKTLNSFTAIDFETAQPDGAAICQIGMVRVENGIISNTLNILVQPPENYYAPFFTEIHGISAEMTNNSPLFNEVWMQLEPFIKNQNVVAHNLSFDYNCLKRALSLYKIEMPEFKQHCTYRIYGKGLSKLCFEHNIELNHHDALSDAKACAELFLKHLKAEIG